MGLCNLPEHYFLIVSLEDEILIEPRARDRKGGRDEIDRN